MGLAIFLLVVGLIVFSNFAITTFGFVTILVLLAVVAPLGYAAVSAHHGQKKQEYDSVYMLSFGRLMWLRIQEAFLPVVFMVMVLLIARELSKNM